MHVYLINKSLVFHAQYWLFCMLCRQSAARYIVSEILRMIEEDDIPIGSEDERLGYTDDDSGDEYQPRKSDGESESEDDEGQRPRQLQQKRQQPGHADCESNEEDEG